MKNFLFLCSIGLFALLAAGLGSTSSQAQGFQEDPENYHYCHRCGMAVEKAATAMTLTVEPESPWYQCCPMCALMDIIESGQGNGTITAYGDRSGKKIEIVVKDGEVTKVNPASAILLVGGGCPINKIFSDRNEALEFIKAHDWAKEKMLKPVAKAFAKLKEKKKAMSQCALCATELKGHEQTTSTFITKDKKRMRTCCAHCLLATINKNQENAKRAAIPDFKSGRMINAKKAYYVVATDMAICCSPSTIAFEKRQDAEEFQKKHHGEIMTYDEALANIDKVMKK
ncbi:MAG: nitrous oxide reductase accessory protein NosL [Thermodesulfobacteriota bacterium]